MYYCCTFSEYSLAQCRQHWIALSLCGERSRKSNSMRFLCTRLSSLSLPSFATANWSRVTILFTTSAFYIHRGEGTRKRGGRKELTLRWTFFSFRLRGVERRATTLMRCFDFGDVRVAGGVCLCGRERGRVGLYQNFRMRMTGMCAVYNSTKNKRTPTVICYFYLHD